jgi:D-arabinose 1-dehydrogenase-like Zn-dependent alcohol dehydrogenase
MSGGHAEYMVAYADATMLLPDGLEYEQAAPLFCAGYTVWSGLRRAEPQPSERLAVVGIGGLGHLAVQYAKAGLASRRSRSRTRPIKINSFVSLAPMRLCVIGKVWPWPAART